MTFVRITYHEYLPISSNPLLPTRSCVGENVNMTWLIFVR